MALRDALYGLAVGDALGVPFEFKARGSFKCTGMEGFGTHYQPMGTWSDDTALTLATCASIKARGRVDAADIRLNFEDWYYDGAFAIDHNVFDVGNTTSSAIIEGMGRDGANSNGNGSLMRIAPLAYTDATDDEIRAVSAITHAHEISCEACVRFVHILRDQSLIAQIELPDDKDLVESGGYVVSTFTAALWCFTHTSSYRDCVLAAVNLGSDTDTTAAVAGALAGEVYGYDAIPAEWLDVLRGTDIIEDCLFA